MFKNLFKVKLEPSYKKPWKGYKQQRELLIRRGLVISDSGFSSIDSWLSHIGYTRLFNYFEPFLKKMKNGESTKTFLPNVDFYKIIELYSFDRKLKLLILDAISKIETSVRANLAYIVGRDYPVIHHKKNAKFIFTEEFLMDKNNGFNKWTKKVKENYNKNYKKHDTINYKLDTIPIWLLIEVWDFGCLSTCLFNLKPKYKDILADVYELKGEGHCFSTWIKNINYLRNICAHHDRLWNNKTLHSVKLSRHPSLKDMKRTNKIYNYLEILYFLLRIIDNNSGWSKRLETRIKDFPKCQFIKIQDMGFPSDWLTQPLWKK